MLNVEMSGIVDCIDTVTPAPKYQQLTILFEYEGKDKPIFEIIG